MNRAILIVAVAILSLTAIKGVLVGCLGPSPLVMDAMGYWQLGLAVGEGDWLMMSEPIAYRTPIYPWTLSLIQSAGKFSLVLLVGLQIVCHLVSVLMAGRLTFDCLGGVRSTREAQWGGVLTMAILLPQIAVMTYVSIALTEMLFTSLLMIHLVSFANYLKTANCRLAAVVGLTYGILLMTRPVVLLLGLAHGIGLAAKWREHSWDLATQRRCSWMGSLQQVGLAFSIVLVIVLPWLVRNQQLFSRPFLTEFVGRNLWIVTFQGGSGAGLPMTSSEDAEIIARAFETTVLKANAQSVEQAEHSWRATWLVSDRLTASGMNDPDADRLMKRVAMDAIKEHPMRFFQFALVRCVNFWRTRSTYLPPVGVTTEEPTQTKIAKVYDGRWTWHWRGNVVRQWIEARLSQSLWFNSLVLLAIMMASLVCVRRRATRTVGIWLAAVLLYFTILTATLEIPAYRYRMVLEPVVATLISVAAVSAIGKAPAAKGTTA